MRNNIHTNQIYILFKVTLFVCVFLPNILFAQAVTDSTKIDLTATDTILSKDALKSKLKYQATDSIRFDLKNKLVFLYGKAEVYYQDIALKSEKITINIDSNLVTAEGKKGDNDKYFGEPVMNEAGKKINAHKIKYNFNTKKGLITEVMTHEGESYIHGKKVYKTPNNVLYIKNGKYTTCNLKNPHYYFSTPKLKIIPKDKIVTGPATLFIEGAPTPLAIPFGFFPNTKKQKSGILIPTPGESTQYGFFMLGGGYYWGINENLNLRLTGDYYSKGSWATNVVSSYKSRYHYSGTVNAKYSIFKNGFKEFPNYSENKDFFFRWNHRQDSKARPNSVFSANVNFGTSSNFTNDFNSTNTDYLSTSFNSTVSYQKSWNGKPFNLSINAYHSQNTITKAITLRLPELAFNVSRIYPFKKKIAVGKQSLIERIGFSYSLNTKNEVTAGDSLFSLNKLNQLSSNFRNGLRQSIPISTSFKVLKNFTVNPAVNYAEVWYLNSVHKQINAQTKLLETDTVAGFVRGNTYNASMNVSTKIYGMYLFKGKMIKAFRHIITPSAGLSYTPQNNSGLSSYLDTNNTKIEYSIFENGIYGTTNSKAAGLLNLSVLNNFEMKVRNRKDSLGVDKKIKLLENLQFSSSYNMIADSLRWSNILISARTNIFKKISLNVSGTLDPYAIDSFGTRINTYEFSQTNSIGRLTSANAAVSFSLKSKAAKKAKKKNSEYGTAEELEYIRANPNQYVDFNIPWTLNVNYNIRYAKPQFISTLIQTLNFSGDFNFTTKWKIGFTSGYDFQAKDLSYTTIDIYRDLHCWEMTFNWVPIGPRQSYLFTIRVKSSILQDLKLTRRNLPNVF